MEDPSELIRQDFLLMLNERIGNLEMLILGLNTRLDALQYNEFEFSFQFEDSIDRTEWLPSDIEDIITALKKALAIPRPFKIDEAIMSPILWKYAPSSISSIASSEIQTGGSVYIKLQNPYFIEQIKDYLYTLRIKCWKEMRTETKSITIYDSIRHTTKEKFYHESIMVKGSPFHKVAPC